MDVSEIERGLVSFLIAAVVVCFLVGVLITGAITWATTSSYIESNRHITPEMIITTKGVQSDTLYIYREP